MKTRWLSVLGCVLLLACAGGDPEDAPAAERTQAERDSILGQSSLPGAGAVDRALETSDAARERAARIDSIQ